MKRRICVVTGTRAEYGLLYRIIKGINDDPALELQLVVTGAHLSPEFGFTVREIENDGFPIAERIEMLLSSDTETSVSVSMGLGMIGFAKAYERLRPDMVLVLGDRFEILAAVAAAVPFGIPVAHIHGGETTEGAMDELFRHAITKMSHVHFTSTEQYRSRVIQMGERPENVFCFGAPGVENARKMILCDKGALDLELDLPAGRDIGVVTYHPATLEDASVEQQVSELLGALKLFNGIYWVVTFPNADTGGRIITKKMKDFIEESSGRGVIFTALGTKRYLSLLRHAVLMIGNSSSGLLEAPSFELPVINIGDRQKGRTRAKNVIDVPVCDKDSIVQAINTALSKEFRNGLEGMGNPYGAPDTCDRIVEMLKSISLEGLNRKVFHDNP